MYTILDEAARRARTYLEKLGARRVAPSATAVEALAELDKPLPMEASDPTETLALLDRAVSPATMAVAGPRFFWFVCGGALPVTVAANSLADAWDQDTALSEVTPGVARLGRSPCDGSWSYCELPSGTGAGFVTGATVATSPPSPPHGMWCWRGLAGTWKATGSSAHPDDRHHRRGGTPDPSEVPGYARSGRNRVVRVRSTIRDACEPTHSPQLKARPSCVCRPVT